MTQVPRLAVNGEVSGHRTRRENKDEVLNVRLCNRPAAVLAQLCLNGEGQYKNSESPVRVSIARMRRNTGHG